ncbi:MAG TPA: glucose 1-dehydrogenase [Anaeromyxobacteraceae bacterium]|nr:glucose 1-dehydrogenase [Anaeromyxobacteraceae bacterium]
MRAVAVFPGERKVRLVDQPEPRREHPSDVLARVLEVGICGTDREIARFEYGFPPPGQDHLVLGHESLVEVIEVGQAVQGLAPGDLAVPMVRRPCASPACPACRSGRADYCVTGEYTERGIARRHGYMAERIADEARWFVPVPRELREVGVLVEPLTVAAKGMIDAGEMLRRLPWLADVPHGELEGARAVVVGAGAVGLLGAMAMRSLGCETWLWSREPADSPQARLLDAIGARYRSSAERPLAELAREAGEIQFMFEATGSARVAFELMGLIGPNGALCLSGVPGPTGPVPVDAGSIMKRLVLRNQLVYGTVNAGPDAFRAAVSALGEFQRRWPGELRTLISSRHDLGEVPALLGSPPVGTKSVVAVAR